MFTVPSPPFHVQLATALQDDKERRLNIIAPRGHAKSSIAACILPLFHLFFEEKPKVIVLVSKTEGHAKRLLLTIKNALDYSVPLRKVVGYWGEHSARVWKETEVILKDGTLIVCRGTGQMVVGLKHLDQRPTLVILDDPEDMMNTKTAEAMEFNLRWLFQALTPSLDAQRGRLVVIGTPQHERCMVETLKGADGWNTLFFQAVQPDGTALWESWMPLSQLMQEKASAESIGRVSMWYREYMCVVVGDEDQLFREQYLRYWDGYYTLTPEKSGKLHITHLNGEKLSPPKVVPVTVFMGVDPASSLSQTADYSTIVPIAVDKDLNRYILPFLRKRVTPMALAEQVLAYYHRYLPQRTRIETVGYQEMLREYLRTREYIPGLEIKNTPRTAKSNRLETLQPFFAKGQFFLMPNMRDMKDELVMYPRGKHDDLLDGLYYANKNVYPPTHAIETGQMLPAGEEEISEDWMIS